MDATDSGESKAVLIDTDSAGATASDNTGGGTQDGTIRNKLRREGGIGGEQISGTCEISDGGASGGFERFEKRDFFYGYN